MTAIKSSAATAFPFAPAWLNPKKDLSSRSEAIKQLINDALEVQDGLNTVKNMLAQLQPNETVSKLVVTALHCQDRFFNLLAASRDSASVLMAHMEDFTQNIVPLVQDEGVSLPDKLSEVKGSAELISTTARQSPLKIREQLEELKTELNDLETRISEWTQELETHARDPMRELSENIRDLESQLTIALSIKGRFLSMAMTMANWNPMAPIPEPPKFRRLPRKDGMPLALYIMESSQAFADIKASKRYEATAAATTQELELKRHELQRWREEIDSKQNEVKKVLQGLKTVKQQFTVLDGRLGNFEDIWEKLMKDIQELNDRLENPWVGGTEQEFQDRIWAEGIVYREIRGALEIYAIQSQRNNIPAPKQLTQSLSGML